jgi:hypothetical protein
MALTGTDAEPVRSAKRFGYSIKMMSGDQIVPVLVTDEALQSRPPPKASGRNGSGCCTSCCLPASVLRRPWYLREQRPARLIGSDKRNPHRGANCSICALWKNSTTRQLPKRPMKRPTLSQSCPCCGGRMIIIETFERGLTPRFRPSPPTPVIRIDTS